MGSQKWKEYFNASSSNDADFFYFLADTSVMVFQYGNWSSLCPVLAQKWRAGNNIVDDFALYLKTNYKYITYDRDFRKND